MKSIMILLTLILALYSVEAQNPKGRVVVDRITSSVLQNPGGENPTRSVTIYLPPGYDKTTNRYPAIYYLHGFTQTDSVLIAVDHLDALLDKAIASGKIKPVIVVMASQHTLYRGSMYTNSPLTGNWADFTAKELVQYVDKNFRTIPSVESRGITGLSMGGGGAIRLGMLFPEVFSCVYAMSPGPLAMVKELGPESPFYKNAAKTKEELWADWRDSFPYAGLLVVAMGRAFSPNKHNPPHYADLPFTYLGDSLVINDRVLEVWNENMPVEMIDHYKDNLKKLKAIKLDWGRNDKFGLVTMGCQLFSQKLENIGVKHFAEEYIGTHTNKIWTDDGRALNDMLPFFDAYLTFEAVKFKTPETTKR